MKNLKKYLPHIRKKHASQKIVFCSGGFDLTHAGHVLFFEDCKRFGDILVVGVAADRIRRSEKKHPLRPVLNEHLRLKMICSLKPVDYAFLITHVAKKKEPPLIALEEIITFLKPDFYIVNSDTSEILWRRKTAQKYDCQLIVLDRTCPPEFEKISTTGIIKKIQSAPKEK